jgi:hypothetical protein
MKGAMKRMSDIWVGIPCPIKECGQRDPNIKSYRIDTPKQRKEIQELLETDHSITGLRSDCENIEGEHRVIITREIR